jgi:hypothetical protein
MGATRALFVILAAQTALILFLTLRFAAVEERLGDLATSVATTRDEPASRTPDEAVEERSIAARASAPIGASPDEIREIVRNEMDALAWRILESKDEKRPAATRPAPSPGDVAALNAAVAGELSSFIASGRASPIEMQALQQKIARLPPGERDKALKQLTKAINDGRLDARF